MKIAFFNHLDNFYKITDIQSFRLEDGVYEMTMSFQGNNTTGANHFLEVDAEDFELKIQPFIEFVS